MTTSSTPVAFPGGPTPPVAAEVSRGLRDAESPLEFIRSNLKTASQPSVEATVVPPPSVSVDSHAPLPEVVTKPASFAAPDLSLEFPSDEPKPEAKPGLETGDPVDDGGEPKKGPEESLKDLRKKANEFAKKLREEEEERQRIAGELERYKSGEAIPEVVQQKDNRISELEKYEHLHALKLSREYQKKFVEPFQQLKVRAESLSKDYGVDTAVLNEALQIDNKRDLNQFLRQHFDDVGALEVREVLLQIKDLDKQAREAEAEPIQAFTRIQEEFKREEAGREASRVNGIISNSKDGWSEALLELRSEGKYPEVTLTDNEEHNAKFVRPVVAAAAEEFGKMMKLLGSLGTKELDKGVAKILAKRFLLSQITPLAAESRAQHYSRAQELLETQRRQNSMLRPQVGGGGNGSGVGPTRPASPTDAAQVLLDKVLPRGR